MEEQKPRRISSIVLGLVIVFSAFTVLNFVSTNVLADEYHDTNWYIEGHQWRNNTTIMLYHCNLQINDSATLTFNYNVTLMIICEQAGDNGIKINSSGKFEIIGTNADMNITSDPTAPSKTYKFENWGTLDFTGATA